MGTDTDQTEERGRITVDPIVLLTGMVGLSNLLVSYFFVAGCLILVAVATYLAFYLAFSKDGLIVAGVMFGLSVILLLVSTATRWMARGVLYGRNAPAIAAALVMITWASGVATLFATGVYTVEKQGSTLPQAAAALVFALLVCISFRNRKYWSGQR
jgi:hypothetical protein